MTVAQQPTPPPNKPVPAQQRPDLHLVRHTEASPETDAEITGPIPVLSKDGQPVNPQAPLDIRVREGILAALKASPRFNQRPASFAESLEYSQRGDWATSEKGAKRAVHGLCTVIAFLATYPLDIALKARTKPVGFVLTIALIVLVTQLL